jgi:hypothetical protein
MPWFMDRREQFNPYRYDYELMRVGIRDFDEELDKTVIRWFPAIAEICELCEGRGTMVSPAIDSHGLTIQDFDDDPEFAENYRAGNYDEPCSRCSGMRIELHAAIASEELDKLEAKAEAQFNEWRDDQFVRWAESGYPQ